MSWLYTCQGGPKTDPSSRFYGQADLAEIDADAASTVGGPARPLAERPLGSNDTKQRMEATFGKDEIWARDTQKILAQQQIESNLSQTAPLGEWTEHSPSRPRTPAEPPMLDVDVPGIDHSKKPTTDWFAGASDSSDGSSDSGAPRRLGRASGEGRRVSLTLEHAMRATAPREHDDEDSTSSEDLPLNQVKAQAAMRQFPPTLQLDSVGGGLSQDASSSDDEELPLSQLLSQKKGALSAIPHLSTHADAAGRKAKQASATNSDGPTSDDENDRVVGEDEEDDDAPLAFVHPNSGNALKQWQNQGADDSDDEPLAVAHPQAAIIAQQAAIINQLHAERAQSQLFTTQSWGMPQHGFPVYGTLPTQPALYSAPSQLDIAGPAKTSAIDNWRNMVAPEMDASPGA